MCFNYLAGKKQKSEFMWKGYVLLVISVNSTWLRELKLEMQLKILQAHPSLHVCVCVCVGGGGGVQGVEMGKYPLPPPPPE